MLASIEVISHGLILAENLQKVLCLRALLLVVYGALGYSYALQGQYRY